MEEIELEKIRGLCFCTASQTEGLERILDWLRDREAEGRMISLHTITLTFVEDCGEVVAVFYEEL